MDSSQFDAAKAETFAERMVDVLNGAALSLMTSIGHRTGLFDVMAGLSPATSEEIAGKAGLNERYVREWLGAMVAGGVVVCDPKGPRYSLPPEHAACLTRASTPNNIAVFTQYTSVLGSVEDRIIECFRNGGGVAYPEYQRFHDVMAEDSEQTVVAALLDHILPLVPGLVGALDQGIDVLDVGCGSGRAVNLMARRFPKSRFVGYDISVEAIRKAKGESEGHGLSNVLFEIKDLTTFDVGGRQFDLITAFDAIHDQAKPDQVLAGIAQALRPTGTFLMQDIAGSSYVHKNIDHPIGPLLYTISCMHCMSVSLAQNGAGLGAMWGEEKAHEMLRDAGFTIIETKRLPHDFQNNFYIVGNGQSAE
jgi:2-polyprenyl-3-methyl-5-hydroxy-6-metoxy-1,4-benzoquinol methylase